MFTGIVESFGQVLLLSPAREGVAKLEVFTTLDLSELPLGGSVAVNGVCLTLTAKTPTRLNKQRGFRFAADLSPETLALTNLGTLTAGACVHLERALRMGDSLGGHLVAGHVDGQALVRKSVPMGHAHELVLEAPAALASGLVPKGSVTLDGVSLTINWVKRRTFQVMLIPHTLALTTLGERRAGDRVNIETDLMAKHVVRVLALHLEARDKRLRPSVKRPNKARAMKHKETL